MNGPVPVMYSIKPHINFSEDIDLPTNMYKMKPYYSDIKEFIPAVINPIDEKVLNSEIESIDTRQSLILQHLKELQTQMELLKKQLTQSQSSSAVADSNLANRSKGSCSVQCTPSVNFNENGIIHDVVINADPKFPPFSLLGVRKLWRKSFNLKISSYVHSSITDVPNEILSQFSSKENDFSDSLSTLNVSLVWKNVGPDCEFIVSPLTQCAIKGEVNILRYFHRHINSNADIIEETLLDSFFDSCYCLVLTPAQKERNSILRKLNAGLGKSEWFGGDSISIRDLAVWSAVRNVDNLELPQKMTKWLEHCNQVINN